VRFVPLAFVVLAGCDQGISLDCAESLASYCSTHGCASSIDPKDVHASFCANQTAIDTFGITGPCPSNGVIVIDADDTQFYYAKTGELEAVLSREIDGSTVSYSCVAGPNPYRVPMTCKSDLVGNACIRDAGAD